MEQDHAEMEQETVDAGKELNHLEMDQMEKEMEHAEMSPFLIHVPTTRLPLRFIMKSRSENRLRRR